MDVGIRAISPKHNIKISVVDLSEGMKEINKLQNANPLAGVALARVTAANALLGLELKNDEIFSSTISTTDGLAKKISTEFQGVNYRSYIQDGIFDPNLVDASKDPVMQVIGYNGSIVVAQTMMNKEPYVSQIELINGNIDANYMNYLDKSNQVKSVLVTATKVDKELKLDKVVGMLIQLFPEHTDEDIDFLDKKLGSNEYLADILLKSTNYTDLIQEIVEDAIVLTSTELHFKCSCSYEKSLRALKMIGKDELDKIISEGKDVEMVCDFCKTKYVIPLKEVEKLAK